ncbi:MAG: DegT/DnrJ/EryC1/StrS family aminotransferase [Candidatus Omnitrophica bacterium]|nr:DegT/DnrJ/EryC1/StrS family aminotransferase [Candidatus Omnitrophota bacterium]
MIRKVPIITSSAGFIDLLLAAEYLFKDFSVNEFGLSLANFLQEKCVYPTNSGIAAFYIILEALKKKSEKKEVVLPAYTAGSLVVAVRKAGLSPVLCDISLGDFNLDSKELQKKVSGDTLAVVCVHMFGIGMADIGLLKQSLPPGIFVIEDCAQAMGSEVKGRKVGCFGDASFFSFNRGKNLALYSGGCIATGSFEFRAQIEGICKELCPPPSRKDEFRAALSLLAFYFATNPFIYGAGYHFISRFKQLSPQEDFEAGIITNFQSGLGMLKLQKIEKIFSLRHDNGMFILDALKGDDGLILPAIPERTYPVFSRLPILFKDTERIAEVEGRLFKYGIETSRMYLNPLHRMFDLGYAENDFANAGYLAEHLLTFPVHQGLKSADLQKIIEAIKG